MFVLAVFTKVFMTIAFVGTIPSAGLLSAIVTQWLAKTFYETAATPLTYLIVNALKRCEGIDVYDEKTRFNPLLLKE